MTIGGNATTQQINNCSMKPQSSFEDHLIRLNNRLQLVVLSPPAPSPRFDTIYDSTSKSDDLPVALVVGINFGQKGTSSSVTGVSDRVGYAKHIHTLAAVRDLKQTDYTVVLWNFYPFLTEKEWTEEVTTTREETKRLFDGGYADPIEAFEIVFKELKPELLVFHGVQSAVPLLARVALLRVNQNGYLVPNLSRGFKTSQVTEIG